MNARIPLSSVVLALKRSQDEIFDCVVHGKARHASVIGRYCLERGLVDPTLARARFGVRSATFRCITV